ncbi:CPBP family intramembrane glutamic endopeptidase [Sporosarcina psychrophila]|uniref:CPBP family intramembrane glutamic endopeptidase n=1 Tax=Sporosarcina psychrophila TaxID=1476 RepID=UPI001E65748F|nr:type II CAAX endopeptidase family protein [Sporosarcina psychrophila]
MMKLSVLLIGPTIMIFLGLIIFKSVPITFILFYGWLLFVPILLYFRNKSIRWNRKKHLNLKYFTVGLISGVISLVAIYGAVALLHNLVFDLGELKQILVEWNFTGSILFWLIIFLIFINPVLEELYWRDVMYKRLIDRVGAAQTIMITSFFYSLYHLVPLFSIFTFPFNFIAVIPVFIAGLMWGYFRYKLNSISASIISHILADLGIMLVYLNYIL